MDSIFQWIFGVRRINIHGELDAWVSVFSTTVERQALNVYVLLIRWREEQTQTTFFGSWKNLSFSKWCCFDFFRCIVFSWKWKSGSNTYPWNKRGNLEPTKSTHPHTIHTQKHLTDPIQIHSKNTFLNLSPKPLPTESIQKPSQPKSKGGKKRLRRTKVPFPSEIFWLQNSLIQRSKVEVEGVDMTWVYPNPH